MSEHLEQLKKARATLVQARRDQARTLANPGAKIFSADARAFTEIQEGIEAVDRAIAEEKAA